jgi:cytochrome c553
MKIMGRILALPFAFSAAPAGAQNAAPSGQDLQVEEGVAASDVPSCAACHGPQAKGDGCFRASPASCITVFSGNW